MVEERTEIQERWVDKKALTVEIAVIVKKWYNKKLDEKEREVEEELKAEWAREHGALQRFRKLGV